MTFKGRQSIAPGLHIQDLPVATSAGDRFSMENALGIDQRTSEGQDTSWRCSHLPQGNLLRLACTLEVHQMQIFMQLDDDITEDKLLDPAIQIQCQRDRTGPAHSATSSDKQQLSSKGLPGTIWTSKGTSPSKSHKLTYSCPKNDLEPSPEQRLANSTGTASNGKDQQCVRFQYILKAG